jgi:flavin-dependent thymidylate synthase
MKCTLIDFTGAGSPDPLYAAKLLVYTKSTRLTQGDETRAKIFAMTEEEIKPELEYIAKTIRSSWEMVDYTFQINDVTRAFTHQLVRTRTASYAQQAQRVVSMHEFETLMPDTIKENPKTKADWETLMKVIGNTYQSFQNAGIPNQDCRGILPTNVYTNIIIKANLRTFADMLAKRKNNRAQGEYASVAREWERLILEVHPWAKEFLSPERLQTPALDEILTRELGSSGPLDKPRVNEALKELDLLKAVWG